ncbi:MAG: hypothetical protein ACR2OE_13165 [Thermomicrobiales bacterium]
MRSITSIIGAAIAVLSVAVFASAASGTTTRCSNPQRAGIKRTASLAVPWRKVPALKSWLDQYSEKAVGMALGSVESGQTGKPFDKETLILQSPKVSVAIYIVAKFGDSSAHVTLERTCINDAFEPWPPFWRRFVSSIKAAGYAIAE